MKNKNLIIWILAIISTISTTALITFWLMRPPAPEDGFCAPNDKNCSPANMKECEGKMMQSLKLNEEQKTMFNNQRKAHHARIEPIFDSIRNLRVQLFNEVDKQKPDSAAINSYIKKIAEQESLLQEEGVANILAMKKFLNEEQVDSMIAFHSRAMMPMGRMPHKKAPHYACKSN